MSKIQDIFSLWITLYKIITFLFLKLYSKNFDKYKIIEKLLENKQKNLQEYKRPIIEDTNKKNKLTERS